MDTKIEPILKAYADADWAGDTNTSGNLSTLGINPIQLITKRQSCIALSSAEAEYVSAASAGKEILCLVKLLEDVELPQTKPTTLYRVSQK